MEKCFVCSRPATGGLRIFTSFLCWSCEQELLLLSVDDPRYLFFVEKIRQALPEAAESLVP
ncbi:MAG: sigma factor G inhibitor Gin [Firmicutes bacterium]|jgi:hypothetical protein|nr:sigma factor G inhibitor Gin [Bacillota bacterium]